MTQITLRKRNLFWTLLILLSTKSFSQKSFITTIDNEKIIVDDNSIDVVFKGEIVTYKTANSDKITDINFKKIKSAVLGDYRMNRMKITGAKEEELCFTIAETNEKKLIGYNKIINTAPTTGGGFQSGGGAVTKSFYFVLDNNNNVLDKTITNDVFADSYAKDRKKAEEVLNKHFSDCKGIMDRLKSSFDSYTGKHSKMINRMSDSNVNIIQFFENPIYTDCNQTTNQTSSTKKIEETKTDFGIQDFTLGVISVDFRGMKRDMAYKGTYSIKNDSLIIATKDASVKYKIISYENGDLKYDDGGVIQTMTISNETGKIKGFTYDTKITFKDKKNGGGNTSYYWCTKGTAAE